MKVGIIISIIGIILKATDLILKLLQMKKKKTIEKSQKPPQKEVDVILIGVVLNACNTKERKND